MIKIKNPDILNIGMLIWAMSQKLPLNYFKQVEDISEFDESFVKNHNKEIGEGYFLEVDIQYPGNLHKIQNDLQFLSERMKIEKILLLIYMKKLNMLFIQEIQSKL